jgi:hypothetical protein
MKRFLSVILALVFISFSSFAQPKEKDVKLKDEAAVIKKQLSLDDKSEHLVYNVLYHVKTRIADIPLGHENYQKLVSYVNDERISMMRSLLSVSKFKEYENIFEAKEKQKMSTILAKNEEYVRANGVLVTKVTVADVDFNFADEENENDEEPSNMTDSKK